MLNTVIKNEHQKNFKRKIKSLFYYYKNQIIIIKYIEQKAGIALKMKHMKFLMILSLAILIEIRLTLGQKFTQQANFFVKLSEYNNFNLTGSFLLDSFHSISIHKCLNRCSKTNGCFYIAFDQQNNCCLFSFNFIYFAYYSTNGNSLIYQKKLNSTNSLINYWRFNGNVNDSVGNAHLYDGINATLTKDRFGKNDSALSLKNGYYKVPPGVYFSGTQLTIMAWVMVRRFNHDSRLIDFGNGNSQKNIVLSLSDDLSLGKPYLFYHTGTGSIKDFSTIPLKSSQWQHLACIFSFPFYSIYIDGIETTTPRSKTNLASFSFENVIRSSNFIGRSNWHHLADKDADADIDDLKFFNRALTQKEIQFEMNNNL